MTNALTPSRRMSQRCQMTKILASWMTERRNSNGTRRFYFQPRSADRGAGWKAQRLYDEYDLAIVDDALAAAVACKPLATLYVAWREGEPDSGPDRIGSTGTVLPLGRVNRKKQRPRFKPGTIGAIIVDYENTPELVGKLSVGTMDNYRYTNGLLIEAFGDKPWRSLSEKAAKRWIEAIMKKAPHLGFQIYTQARAVLGKAHLLYDSKSHPGYIPRKGSPFHGLDIGRPMAQLIVWPQAAVDAFVRHCDDNGAPSLGDAMVMACWLGPRRQDWRTWPRNFFDQSRVGFVPAKTRGTTGRAVVIDWDEVPALAHRLTAAKARLEMEDKAHAIRPSTFFHDADGRPWTEKSFGEAFRALRKSFAENHPRWPTNYMANLLDDDPFAVPTELLTMRIMRHTCVTLHLDAGNPPSTIRSITGHTLKSIQTIENNYRALTAAQSGRALALRSAHEAKP